jgi:hypothetical protein
MSRNSGKVVDLWSYSNQVGWEGSSEGWIDKDLEEVSLKLFERPGETRKTPVRIASNSVKIRTEYLANRSL